MYTPVTTTCRPSPASAPPALQRFARDLTEEARRGLLDPLLGRQQVLMRLVQVSEGSMGTYGCMLYT